MQSRKMSLIESITNVIIGYFVALLSQLLIFPVFDIDVTLSQNIKIGLFFTVISILRSYILRRIFNAKNNLLKMR
jgi:hypothetical protein